MRARARARARVCVCVGGGARTCGCVGVRAPAGVRAVGTGPREGSCGAILPTCASENTLERNHLMLFHELDSIVRRTS